MTPIKFAKLFDIPNGGQVLVTKEINTEDNSTAVSDIRFEARFELDGGVLTPSICAGFETEKERDEDFEKVDQQQAEDAFKLLTNQFEYIINKL